MRIYIGCDDSGFAMKQVIMDLLDNKKIPFIDCGSGPEPSRYPYYAAKVAGQKVKQVQHFLSRKPQQEFSN